MIIESIGSMFLSKLYVSHSVSFFTLFPSSLVLREDINKLMHYASQPCEQMFGNMRQSDRYFNCRDFFNHVDKQNRRLELTCKNNLSMAKEDGLKGYQEKFADFIITSKMDECCAGTCQVETGSSVTLSLQS